MNAAAVSRFLLARRRPLFALLLALAVSALALTTYTFVGTEFTAAREVPLGTNTSTGFEKVDFDQDGIPDIEESVRAGTDVLNNDTDGDGMLDGWEARYRATDPLTGRLLVNPLIADAQNDPDRDNLTNLQEFRANTDPTRADTDGDGMPDAFEVRFGLDPLKGGDEEGDLDGDGLSNLEESRLFTDPKSTDTDGDGLTDPEELAGRGRIGERTFTFTPTDPTRASTSGSGVPDGWAIFFGLDPRDVNVGFADPDKDGLGNVDEYRASVQALQAQGLEVTIARLVLASLSPVNADTDGDGISDGWEVRYVLDPLRASDATEDPDGDGLTNLEEFKAGASPRSRDTDGDGLDDRLEVQGYDLRLGGKTVQVTSNPASRDTDADGLGDREERDGEALLDGVLRRFPPTNPRNPDSDFDGIPDADEVGTSYLGRFLNPVEADTDGDGLPDGKERSYWTLRASEAAEGGGNASYVEPLRKERAARGLPALDNRQLAALLQPEGDVDGDGLANIVDPDSDGDGDYLDGTEVTPPDRENRPVPATAPWLLDTDQDGLPDRWELLFMGYDVVLQLWNLDPSLKDSDFDGIPDPQEDIDGDGVQLAKDYIPYTNLEEFQRGTSPTDKDSDKDVLPDGWEVYYGERHRAPLSPLVPTDNLSEITRFPYVRLVNVGSARTPDEINASLRAQGFTSVTYDPRPVTGLTGDVYPDVSTSGGGNITVVRVSGVYRFTYLAAYLSGADPSLEAGTSRVRHDSDGDGMPDAWEAFMGLKPGADDAEGNPDDEFPALSNLKEYLGVGANARPAAWDDRVAAWGRGTNPKNIDSDFDGLEDGYEAENGLDPLNPYDAIGDLDGDGLTNRREGELGTNARSVDTDRDGLLDGETMELDEGDPRLCLGIPCIQLFLQEGIVHDFDTLSRRYRFYGEALIIRGERVVLNPADHDTDKDVKPDGWEVRYTKRTRDGQLFHPNVTGDENHDEDDLQDLNEYLTGRPATWRESRDGVWWGGGDPNLADSDGDCTPNDRGGLGRPFCLDGGLDSPLGDRDYDNDGLNDFLGEDPYPFTNPLNVPGASPTTAAALLKWIDEDRPLSWRQGPADAQGVPYTRARAEARIDVSAVTGLSLGTEAATLLKGVPFVIEGNVTAPGTSGSRVGVPNVTVLVTPYPLGAAASDVAARRERADSTLCAGFSDRTGAFRLTCTWQASQSVPVPNGAVLMGLTSGTAAWTFDTKSLPLGPLGLELWTYATNAAAKPGEGAYGDYQARARDLTGTQRDFVAHAVSSTSLRLETDRAGGLPLTLASGSSFLLTPEDPVTGGETLTGTGKLVDGAGDPIAEAPVLLSWSANPVHTREVTTGTDGSFAYTFPVQNYSAPRLVPLKAAFPGMDAIRATEKEIRLQVALKTRLVPDPVPILLAGETVPFTGRLLDLHGNAVPLAPVEVDFKDYKAQATTDSRGRYSVQLPVPANAKAGPAEGNLRHLGSDQYLPVSQAVSSIVKKPSVIRLETETPVGLLGTPLVIRGRVTDPTGTPVRSLGTETLTLQVTAGGYSGLATVQGVGPKSGEFTLTIPADFYPAVGRHPMTARFLESKLFGTSTTAGEVVIRSPVTLTLEDTRIVRNATVLLRGTAKDARGSGIPDLPLNFTLGGERLQPQTTGPRGAFQIEIF
ncbi:MAG TPA: hypothetical protein VNZ52_11455, partial [Candidatus Thermoplasmatota archaeon]|nr:hypothetical protein [Candidatus Thermoplasmatota archaeon]